MIKMCRKFRSLDQRTGILIHEPKFYVLPIKVFLLLNFLQKLLAELDFCQVR